MDAILYIYALVKHAKNRLIYLYRKYYGKQTIRNKIYTLQLYVLSLEETLWHGNIL